MVIRTIDTSISRNGMPAISAAQCDFILKSEYIPPYKSDPYACNTFNIANEYIFKVIDLNMPASSIHQFRNALERFCKRDQKGKGFITNGWRAWFSISSLYENTTHIYSYHQVAFHKLSSIKSFNKIPDDVTINIVFNKFVDSLSEYKYNGWTLESLDERTCLKFLNSLINPATDLLRHIKMCKRVENQVMDAVLEDSKSPLIIQSKAKA